MGNKLTRRIATVELADGRILVIRILNPDLLRWEDTAQRHGWPRMEVKDGVGVQVTPQKQTTFLVWAALKRTGQYDGTFETFAGDATHPADCIDIDIDEEEVDPTPPAPTSGSSPSSPGSDAAPSVPLTPSVDSLLPTTS